MIGQLTLGAALLLGVAGSAHCMAMCGSISAAFGLSGAARHPILVPLLASLGRVAAYAGLGALVGSLGAGLSGALVHPAGIQVLRLLASLILVLMGLQLLAWVKPLDQLARLGAPLWARLQPLSRRLFPVDTLPKALGFGLIWGLLPCGLVYGMLTLAVGFASPWQSAMFMGAFGLGTLPALLGLGVAAGRGGQAAAMPAWRRPIGALLILFGVFFYVAPWLLPESGPLAALRPLLDCH